VIWSLPIVVALFSSPAVAADRALSVGFVPGVAVDLGSQHEDLYAEWEPGFTYSVPFWLEMHPNLALRFELSGVISSGSDRLYWTETHENTEVTYFQDIDTAYLVTTDAYVGPEVRFSDRTVGLVPSIQASAGVRHVQTHHDIASDAAAHIREWNHENDADVRPYTLQLAPAARIGLGFSWLSKQPFAVRAEMGYTVSFVEARPLVKAESSAVASRAAYGLRALSLGVGAALSF